MNEMIHHELHPAILVAPSTPYVFDHEDFSELVREIVFGDSGLMADQVQIRLGYLYGDAWPPGWTWINFILDESAAAAIGSIVTAITVWGRNWLNRARQKDPHAQPIKAVLYGPNGEVLREVEVMDPQATGRED